jgi:hypothetical protein
MTRSLNHKVIEVRIEDYDYIDNIRKTPIGNISFTEIIHKMVDYWKEGH